VDLLGLGTLVKYGSETLFGYVPKKVSDLAAKLGKKVSDMPLKVLTSDKVQEELRTTLQSTYEQLSIDLVAAHKAYRTKEAKMEKDKLIHGNITEQKQQDFDAARKLYEKLLAIVTTLSECIGHAMPVLEVRHNCCSCVCSCADKSELVGCHILQNLFTDCTCSILGTSLCTSNFPFELTGQAFYVISFSYAVCQVEKAEEDGTGGLTVWEGGRDTSAAEDLANSAAAAGGLFGDPETRAFYEELPDLLAAVPLTVLGLTPEQVCCGYLVLFVVSSMVGADSGYCVICAMRFYQLQNSVNAGFFLLHVPVIGLCFTGTRLPNLRRPPRSRSSGQRRPKHCSRLPTAAPAQEMLRPLPLRRLRCWRTPAIVECQMPLWRAFPKALG
jgi:hypothetical protein